MSSFVMLYNQVSIFFFSNLSCVHQVSSGTSTGEDGTSLFSLQVRFRFPTPSLNAESKSLKEMKVAVPGDPLSLTCRL